MEIENNWISSQQDKATIMKQLKEVKNKRKRKGILYHGKKRVESFSDWKKKIYQLHSEIKDVQWESTYMKSCEGKSVANQQIYDLTLILLKSVTSHNKYFKVFAI